MIQSMSIIIVTFYIVQQIEYHTIGSPFQDASFSEGRVKSGVSPSQAKLQSASRDNTSGWIG